MKNKKLNIIDYIILLVVVAALALVGYKFIKSRSDNAIDADVPMSTASVRFSVLCQELDPELAENIAAELSAGEYEIDGVQVSSCRIYNSGKLMDAMIIDWETEEKDGNLEMRFTVEASPTLASGVYTLGWQEIRLGKDYNLKTLGVEIDGSIVGVEKLG